MIKIKGLDQLKRNLDALSKKAKELDGKHSVPVEDLLTRKFLAKNTSFTSFESMVKAAGYEIDQFEAIPDEDWDEFIRSNTKFFYMAAIA